MLSADKRLDNPQFHYKLTMLIILVDIDGL